MKVRSSNVKRANGIFTDREEPRAAFWQKYNEATEGDAYDIRVLSYYGIGGIGKSTLLAKLSEEMEERLEKPYYIACDFYDFKECTDMRNVLLSLRNKLQEKYKFKFPNFEVALYLYAEKTGQEQTESGDKSILSKSSLAESLVDITKEIPLVSVAGNIISAADKVFAFGKGIYDKNKAEYKAIEALGHQEIYQKLAYYFALDMQKNMEKISSPFVIFIDTYELLVNELSSVGEPLNKDWWLRGEDGLIQNMPNTIWVIAGREKLKWERFDPEWRDALEQHILGNLSKADSTNFLKEAGISDEELRDGIYNLTDGTPIYLDLCVDRYNVLAGRGEVPKIQEFGHNMQDLIERFIRYMDDGKKDMVYAYSCLGSWDDEMAQNTISNFSFTAYEKTKELSFVIVNDNGSYMLHETIKDVLFKNCPDIIKRNTFSKAMEYCKSKFDEDFERFFALYTYYGTIGADNVLLFFTKEVAGVLTDMVKRGRIVYALGIVEQMMKHVDEGTEAFARMLGAYSFFLKKAGDKIKAVDYAKRSYELQRELYGEMHERTLIALYRYGRNLEDNYQTKQAEETYKKIIDLYDSGAELKDKWLCTALSAYAFILHWGLESSREKEEEHIKIRLRLLDLQRKLLDKFDEEKFENIGILKMEYENKGEYEKVCGLQAEVLEYCAHTYGDKSKEYFDQCRMYAYSLKKAGKKEEALEFFLPVMESASKVLDEKSQILRSIKRTYDQLIAEDNNEKNTRRAVHGIRESEEEPFDYRGFVDGLKDYYYSFIQFVVKEWCYTEELKEDEEQYRLYLEDLIIHKEAFKEARAKFDEFSEEFISAQETLIGYLILGGFYEEAHSLFDELIATLSKNKGANHEELLEYTELYALHLDDIDDKRGYQMMKELIIRKSEAWGRTNIKTIDTWDTYVNMLARAVKKRLMPEEYIISELNEALSVMKLFFSEGTAYAIEELSPQYTVETVVVTLYVDFGIETELSDELCCMLEGIKKDRINTLTEMYEWGKNCEYETEEAKIQSIDNGLNSLNRAYMGLAVLYMATKRTREAEEIINAKIVWNERAKTDRYLKKMLKAMGKEGILCQS